VPVRPCCQGFTYRRFELQSVFRLLSAALALVLGAALSACDKSASQSAPQMPPPEVNAVAVQPRDIPITLQYVGRTEGVREVEVRSRVGGILMSWNYTEGSTVKAGQSLFTVDPVPYQTVVARGEADLASSKARHVQAQRDIERLKPLLDQGMVSRKAWDDAIAAEEVGAAQVRAAEAALTEAKLNLGYTRVEAPIAGVSGRALKSEGSLVEAQNTLLTTISQIDPIRVIFSMSEGERLRFNEEASAGRLRLPRDNRFVVTLELADGSRSERPGMVDFSDIRVDAATGTSEFRAVIPNPDHRIRPGQFVRVTLQGAQYPKALAVPQRAVLEAPQGGKIVFTVDDKNLAQPRPVQVGQWAGEDWVITGGLNAGDRVILDGVMKIRPGAPVAIAKPAAPPPQPQAAAKP
jgi:membrane fusion protein (multidrug efflux system)